MQKTVRNDVLITVHARPAEETLKADLVSRRVKYAVAHTGAITARGGLVEGSGGMRSLEVRAALVGDHVRYPDGSTAQITSGAGFALMERGVPYAVVGSHVSGGDHIVSTSIDVMQLAIFENARPDGFLVEGYRSHE